MRSRTSASDDRMALAPRSSACAPLDRSSLPYSTMMEARRVFGSARNSDRIHDVSAESPSARSTRSIFAPVAATYGIDPVHFGVMVVVNLALGMITPPLGVNLFAACAVAEIPVERIIPQLMWFVLVVFACLMLVTYIPAISLWPVEMLMGPAGP